ncbi:unnamed protein product [Paramecium octaurelia]|uniref:Uncharacterized protein n=1 Tax=Paramecium octaurelia TaxID=43137 RepID=A0A8S1TNA5_PAROT|nr:unnamed protein product [Paramecium octaurelia]
MYTRLGNRALRSSNLIDSIVQGVRQDREKYQANLFLYIICYIFINIIKQLQLKMGQTQGSKYYNNADQILICTLCREEKPQHHFHCGKCRKKALICFGATFGFGILAIVTSVAQLSDGWRIILSILMALSFFGGCYFCQSKLTTGTIRQYVEIYD